MMKRLTKYMFVSLGLVIFLLMGNFTHAATGTTYAPTKVDMVKIRTARLSRHNAERKIVGLPAYTGSVKLDMTAQKRADNLAKINQATHKRKSTDGYYNYNSIKARFTGQKINFPAEKLGIPNFTENIAYQTYKCTKSDCTDDLIAALKKGFAFFMSEKSYKGPHYKAIIGKQFKLIGMGVGIVGTRYYVVTHYATQIIK